MLLTVFMITRKSLRAKQNFFFKSTFVFLKKSEKRSSQMNSLVEPAGKFSMLHPSMHSKFFIKLKNIESTHGEIL